MLAVEDMCKTCVQQIMVGIAQLVSAPDCGSGGRGFKSHYPPLIVGH